ncbi:MAG: alpha-mannosidase [Halanaerobiaceae bacterium]
MKMKQMVNKLKEKADKSYWGKRLLAELNYGARVSKVNEGKYDQLLKQVLEDISRDEQEVITEEQVARSEEQLEEMVTEAKKYTMICAGHAHIDMNWQWRWDETVSITMDTFRTVLDLMEEYPEFKFSQSQASVYRIMEKYDPETLAEIKKRVHEGRWEITASTWVEANKNISSGESMVRQILYTKNYLSQLLDIDPDSLTVDFEPDTFGHSFNVPEVLSQGGIKYYYHCRGYDGHNLYRWQGKSGKKVLVNREGAWYNDRITPEMAGRVPEFCDKHGINYLLKVYGVGDHGGGPTRRDLERINDMKKWPVFPEIKFGTFKEYFKELEKVQDNLPVVNDELNFVFTGCYTSQSRIKKGNRITENNLVDAEVFNTFSDVTGNYNYLNQEFFTAWENTLLNQFHDILPGSGVRETREHAMGLYQETLAVAASKRKLALRKISDNIDTSGLLEEEKDIEETVSEGAGVGFGVEDFKIAQTSRGKGKTRVFHVFNPAVFDREEVVEFVVWDWPQDKEDIIFENSRGEKVKHQIISRGRDHYWGHKYIKVLVKVQVPAGGYSTYVLREDEDFQLPDYQDLNPRTEGIEEFKLENSQVKAEFDSQTGALISFVDKETGREYIEQEGRGIFRLVDEDAVKGMTAWRVGRYMNVTPLDSEVKMKNILDGELRKAIQVEVEVKDSTVKAIISLDENSNNLNFDVACEWLERGIPGDKVPQLNFNLPLNYECSSYKYDIPFGTINREGMKRDVPGNSFILGVPEDEESKAIMLLTDSRNGFRGYENNLSVSLLRSTFDPDLFPELGEHKFSFQVSLQDNQLDRELLENSYQYNHSLQVVSGSRHQGELAPDTSFVKIKQGNVALSGIKVPEESETENNSLLIRVYETEGQEGEAVLELFKEPTSACFVDINEHKQENKSEIEIVEQTIKFKIGASNIANILVEL